MKASKAVGAAGSGIRLSVSLAVAGTTLGSVVAPYAAMANAGFVPHQNFAVQHSSAGAAANAAFGANSAHGVSGALSFPVSHVLHTALVNNTSNSWHAGSLAAHTLAGSSANSTALNLSSNAAVYSASSLVNFDVHGPILINIGGKQITVDASTKLTAAELVAAQQVVAGKQEIKVNANGIATGGTFELSSSSLQALDTAIGGNISSLTIGHGVKTIDTISTLNLSGNFVNNGKLLLENGGNASQTSDTINALNFTNGLGGVITSIGLGSSAASDITLGGSNSFENDGRIAANGSLNINAANIVNSGTLAAATGSVNFAAPSGASIVNFTGTGGSVQANQGSINFNVAGVSNLNVVNGDFASNALNFNAAGATVNATMGEVTGVINGTADVAHVTADTANMHLGNLVTTGDPTYYNSGGNILIDGSVAATNGADLAIVASGNVIGAGGVLDTSSATTGGALTVIAGANFATTPNPASGAGDTTTTITLTDSANAGKGSATGGYIDLSGTTLTTTGSAVTTVSTHGGTGNGGDVLMVAYKGTAANSGSIIATGTSKSGGATTVDASSTSGTAGNVTLIGGGAQITAQSIVGNNVSLLGGTPTLAAGTGSLVITDGSITSGSYSTAGNPTATAINLTGTTGPVVSAQSLTIQTAGKVTGSATAPLSVSATNLSIDATGATSSVFLTDSRQLVILNEATVGTSGTFSLTLPDGAISIANNIVASKIVLTADGANGAIVNGGAITASTSAILESTGVVAVVSASKAIGVTSGGAVNIFQGVTSYDAVTILPITAQGNVSITSAEPVNVTNVITTNGGNLSILDNGNFNSSGGINITKAPVTGTGNISLTTAGNDGIKSSVVLAAPVVAINSAAGGGTASAPIQAKASTELQIDSTSLVPLYVKDTNTTASVVGSTNSSSQGSTIVLSSLSTALTLANFGTVSNLTVTDAVKNAVTTIGAGATVGDGTGTVKITSAGDIAAAGNTSVISANTATLVSTTGSIGTSAQSVTIDALNLSANAVKGDVYLASNSPATANVAAGTALGVYSIDSVGGINLVGSLTAKTATTGVVSLTAQSITQSAVGFLTGANIDLDATNIGLGTGAQSVQTKAVKTLQINENVNGTGFVTQNGTLDFAAGGPASTGAAGSNLTLAFSTGSKVTFDNSFNFPTLTITAPTSVTVNADGKLTSQNLTINATSLITAGTGVVDTAGGALTLNSPTTLSVTGPAGSITLGNSVSLTGLTSITLGAASGGANNPLANIGSGVLDNLTIFTKGVFTGAYTAFSTTSGNDATSLSITASSLKNSGTKSLAPIIIASLSKTDADVSLTLTGTQGVVIGNATVTLGQPQYDIFQGSTGAQAGSITISAAGNLTFEGTSGLNIAPTKNDSISLTGNTLPLAPLGNTFFSDGLFSNVSLTSTGNAFTVGAVKASELVSGMPGTINVTGNVSIAAPAAINVNNSTINGGSLSFNTSNFKLNAGSELTGDAGTAAPTLFITNLNTGNLTITNSTTALGYDNFASVNLQANKGALNVGTLFTTSQLLGNGTATNISLAAGGAITLPGALQNLDVANNGSIFISGSTINYTPGGTAKPYLTLGGNNATVNLNFNTTSIVLGQARGDIDIQTNNTISVNTAKTLTINESLTAVNGTYKGAAVVVNQDIMGTNTTVLATNSKSTNNTNRISGLATIGGTNSVTLGQNYETTGSVPLSIQAENILNTEGGALNLSNFSNGHSISVQQVLSGTAQAGFTLSNTSGASNTTLSLGSIFTTNGKVDIVNNNGGILLTAGSTIKTTNGSIILENNDLNGTIELGQNSTVYGSGKSAGVGNVDIILGAIPTGTIVGSLPSPNVPITTASGSGVITYTTSKNPTASITSLGTNFLSALGRNIVFNGAGNSSAIQLDGNVHITADPPVVSGGAATAVAAYASNASIAPAVFTANAAAASSAGAPIVVSSASTSAVSNTAATTQVIAARTLPVSNLLEQQTSEQDLQAGISDGIVSSLRGRPGQIGLVGGVSVNKKGKKKNEGEVTTTRTMTDGLSFEAPKQDTKIQTSLGTVSLSGGAVAMLFVRDGYLAVYNLHDTRSGAVQVALTNGQSFKLNPGQNAVFTSKAIHSFEEVNPIHSVAYRKVISRQAGEGLQAFQSEFNILSMLGSVDALKQMVNSKDGDTRRVVDSILKTSAILMQFGGEQYELMKTAPVTALNN